TPGRPDLTLRHLPVRRCPRGRRTDGPRGHRVQGERGPAVLPDVTRHGRGRGDGDDRARLRRADRQGAPDGVRPGAQPPHRTADGRGGALSPPVPHRPPPTRTKEEMTITTDEKPAVAPALETSDRVASHLHPEPSYDLAAHPVPSGLEEVWRFTPLK